MKNLLMLLTVLTAFQSCQEEPSVIPDIYRGEATATKNDQPWSGLIYAHPYESPHELYGFYIHIDVYNERELLREVLIIFKIPYNVQKK